MASNRKLEQLLVKEGLVSEDQLQKAVAQSRDQGTRLGQALVQLGHINENVYATFLGKIYGLQAVSLDGIDIPTQITSLIPRVVCEQKCIVPLALEENKLSIAVSDPSDVGIVDDVRFLTNLDVQVYVSTETSIQKAIAKCYPTDPEADMIDPEVSGVDRAEATTGIIELQKEEEQLIEEDFSKEKNKPSIRIINKVLYEAMKRGASDIHIEPFQQYSRVRFRINGSLYEVMRIPTELRTAIPARIKVMSHLDISEHRIPQDGRLQMRTSSQRADVRVSVLPTVYGEKIVMRILGQTEEPPSLEEIGFEKKQLALFKEAANLPYGMVLVTGPTGSGKSTTLFAALSEQNSPEVNISTVEDPIEYKMFGINQSQIKENVGLTFAAALRSLLRQDPDIVMVGEIRDLETAEIAIKAALTGHMVFSTLHTNDAPSTVTRLVHMGIEPFLISAALSLVQAQRLIRILCPDCKIPDTVVTENDLLQAGVPKEHIGKFTPMAHKGCEKCKETGYIGRRGIFEVMPMTEELRKLVVKGADSDQLKIVALEQGMQSLRMSAIFKLIRGETSLYEVLTNSRSDQDMRQR